jgi:hypothetical protein
MIYTVQFIGNDGVWAAVRLDGVPVAWFKEEKEAQAFCDLRAVYERFKHLDKILMDSGFDDGGIQRPIQRECWKAIKAVFGVSG